MLALGLFRGGFLLRFFSRPLTSGFLFAAAIITFVSQLEYIFFNDLSGKHIVSNSVTSMLYELVKESPNMHWPTLGISTAFIAGVWAMKKYHHTKHLYSMIMVLLASLLAYGLHMASDHSVNLLLTGRIKPGVPHWDTSVFEGLADDHIPEFIQLTSIIAMVAFLEQAAAAQLFAIKHNYTININQELIAAGMANIFGAMFQCMPTMGSIGGTAMLATFGGESYVGNFVSAITVLLFSAFLTPLFTYLPKACLAIIVMSAVLTLIKDGWKEVSFLFAGHRRDLYIWMSLVATTLALGIDRGLIVAVLFNGISHVYRSGNTQMVELGREKGTVLYSSIKGAHDPLFVYDGVTVLQLRGPIFFGNEMRFKSQIEEYFMTDEKLSKISRALILDCTVINFIDATGVHALEEIAKEYVKRDKLFLLAGCNAKVWSKLRACGLHRKIGKDHFFATTHDAVETVLSRQKRFFHKWPEWVEEGKAEQKSHMRKGSATAEEEEDEDPLMQVMPHGGLQASGAVNIKAPWYAPWRQAAPEQITTRLMASPEHEDEMFGRHKAKPRFI